MKSWAKCIHLHSRKCIWKCRLRNGGNFVSASNVKGDGICLSAASNSHYRALPIYRGHLSPNDSRKDRTEVLTHGVLCLVQSIVLYCYAIYRKSAVFAFISLWIVLSHSAGPGFCSNLSYIVMPYVIDTKCPAYSILHSTLINWVNIYLGGGMSPIRCQNVTMANAY